jgi:UDP-glucose:(heptosyl)LPS alpha-1,3-glucosyltransferase
LLHPTFYDPCSLVVLEAIGSGIPVLTTGYNGAAELIKKGSAGWVVEDPRDKQALAMALGDILHEDHYPVFRENAAKLGCLNSFSRHVDRMEQWILEDG